MVLIAKFDKSVHVQVNFKSRANMKSFSIGEIARRTGLKTSALRYYEAAGVLPAAARVNGRRRYNADMVQAVEVLRFAQQAGFTLEDIKVLFRGFDRGPTLGARWRSLAKTKLAELDALLANAARMRHAIEAGLKCNCVRLEDCTLPGSDVRTTKLKRGRGSVEKARS
jgi:MerR family redox-sensitive transcriptional activator SoxR